MLGDDGEALKAPSASADLFFEVVSSLQVLCLAARIRKAKRAYFHEADFPGQRHASFRKRLTRRLLRTLNPRLELSAVPRDVVARFRWEWNNKAIEYAERSSLELEKSRVLRTTRDLVGDRNIIKVFKFYLVRQISSRGLFLSLAKTLSDEKEGNLYVVPYHEHKESYVDEISGARAIVTGIPTLLSILNRSSRCVDHLFLLLTFVLVPLGFAVMKMKRLTWRPIQKVIVDLALPVLFGFHGPGKPGRHVGRPRSDDDLYSGKVKKGMILHIFNFWRYGEEIEREYREEMDKRGIPYVDVRHYRLTASMVLRCLLMQMKMLQSCIRNWFFLREENGWLLSGSISLFRILDAYHQFENIDYKVSVLRNDYSSSHIGETIVANKLGKKTVALQHNTTPFICPQLAYVHVDKYLVFGTLFLRLYAPHWERMVVVKTGRETIDWVFRLSNDEVGLEVLKKRFFEEYPQREHNVVMTFPGGGGRNLLSKWDAVYDSLLELKSNQLDFNLFLRFRHEEDLDKFPYIGRFRSLPEIDERIVIGHGSFDTYEFMVLADVFISTNSSFTVFESLSAGCKVFTFDMAGHGRHVFAGYGRDLVLESQEDLRRVFDGLANNFKGFECEWERLRRDSNFIFDGNNQTRIQEAVWETLVEVDSSAGMTEGPGLRGPREEALG